MPSVILTEKVEEFLQFAHIPTDRISWSHELIQFVEYELWRSDEYGNQAIVGRCRNKTDAILLQSEYERKGHKQFYWVKSMNSDRKPAV